MELYGAYIYTEYCVIRIYFYGTSQGTLIEFKVYFFGGSVLFCRNFYKGIEAEYFQNKKIRRVMKLKKYYNEEIK